MNKFFQFIFILFGIIFVLKILASLSLDRRLEELDRKIDRLEMFLNLDLNADEEVGNE